MNDYPNPYVQFRPGAPVTADGFNRLQTAALEALDAHTHARLPADAVRPDAALKVKGVEVGELRVAGRDPASASLVSKSGGSISGNLEVQGSLTVGRQDGAVSAASRPRILTFYRGEHRDRLDNTNRNANAHAYAVSTAWPTVVYYPGNMSWTPLSPFFTESLDLEVPSRLVFSILGYFRSGVRIELRTPSGERRFAGTELVSPDQSSELLEFRTSGQQYRGTVIETLDAPKGKSTLYLYCQQINFPAFMMQILVVPGGGGA